MKKLHLNKIFHWLYAFLMFVPVFVVLGNLLYTFGTGNSDGLVSLTAFSSYFESGVFGFSDGVTGSIWHVFDYLLNGIFYFGDMSDCIASLLTYWTVVSVGYLVFDVLMLPINIAHYWIDKGCDRL